MRLQSGQTGNTRPGRPSSLTSISPLADRSGFPRLPCSHLPELGNAAAVFSVCQCGVLQAIDFLSHRDDVHDDHHPSKKQCERWTEYNGNITTENCDASCSILRCVGWFVLGILILT